MLYNSYYRLKIRIMKRGALNIHITSFCDGDEILDVLRQKSCRSDSKPKTIHESEHKGVINAADLTAVLED